MWQRRWQIIWGVLAFLAIVLTFSLENTNWLKISIWVVIIILGVVLAVKHHDS